MHITSQTFYCTELLRGQPYEQRTRYASGTYWELFKEVLVSAVEQVKLRVMQGRVLLFVDLTVSLPQKSQPVKREPEFIKKLFFIVELKHF